MSYLIERPMVTGWKFPEPHRGLAARLDAASVRVRESEVETATVAADRALWAALGAMGLAVGLFRVGRKLVKSGPINP